MRIKAFIAGIGGTKLTADEVKFFTRENPWGFILFARNVADPEQVRSLTGQLRSITGRDDTPILIDQEGGRVQRLRPPHWPSYPAGRLLGAIYSRDRETGLRAAWLQSRLIANDLHSLGINVDCLPVLDAPVKGSHDVIGDRAYSFHPHVVAEMGRAACLGLLAGGVLPVIKHIPGHGRAAADSHLVLPVVDNPPGELGCTDFYPFMQLADMPLAMTAHVVYSGIDADAPATTSATIVKRIIRGWLGFDGLLISDDLSMQALSGDYAERARSSFAAGCDIVLHCNGDMGQMQAIAPVCPALAGEAKRRAHQALTWLKPSEFVDAKALRDELDEMMRLAA